ncbi:transcriptional regulator [Mixta calida]|uniref:transcriptional regulator n=1 Tax=Mixta calida TaxID=665913 RepID=UPI0034D6E368
MNLKQYIAEQGGNATKLAQQMGISLPYLSQMASGKTPISPRRAVEIEKYTNKKVTRIELFSETWREIWPELNSANRSEELHNP